MRTARLLLGSTAIAVTLVVVAVGCGSTATPSGADAATSTPDGSTPDAAVDAVAVRCLSYDASFGLSVCGSTCIPNTPQCEAEVSSTAAIGPGRCLVVQGDHTCKGYGVVGCPPGACP